MNNYFICIYSVTSTYSNKWKKIKNKKVKEKENQKPNGKVVITVDASKYSTRKTTFIAVHVNNGFPLVK